MLAISSLWPNAADWPTARFTTSARILKCGTCRLWLRPGRLAISGRCKGPIRRIGDVFGQDALPFRLHGGPHYHRGFRHDDVPPGRAGARRDDHESNFRWTKKSYRAGDLWHEKRFALGRGTAR